MIDYINISTLNDFIFCPYSIYLHNVYMDTDEMMYHAFPQTQGRITHESVDNKTSNNRNDVILALPVYSERYGIMGKIDVYKRNERKLIERKYQLKQIFQGQIYQLWGQMFCMREMGYEVTSLAFYEMSTNKMIPVLVPSEEDERKFMEFITSFRNYHPDSTMLKVNPNKCRHCIYCNMCDKASEDNVYA